MKEQLGAKLMQFTLGLEGCCLIGPWGVGRGLQTWLGLWLNPESISFLPNQRTVPPRPPLKDAFFP